MIVFITLLYVGVIALLIKIKVIRLNLFWKISPLLGMLLLFVILFIPMQWGAAAAGSVTMYQTVMERIPRVTGGVSEVTAKPLVPVKAGDASFKIDPVPTEAKLDQLSVDLQLAEVNLKRAKTLAKRGVDAIGAGAIYTNNSKVTHIIRRIMIRMNV